MNNTMNTNGKQSSFIDHDGIGGPEIEQMTDVTSDEIYHAIADTISTSVTLKPSDPSHPLMSFEQGLEVGHHLIESVGDELQLEGGQLDALSAAAVPVIDDFVLADLQDPDQGYSSVGQDSGSPVPKKRKNKGDEDERKKGEDEEVPTAAKKVKTTAVRDPNAVSKVVPWETW